MALDPKFFVSINLQDYVVDKDTGLPLAGGYAAFYKDTARTEAKPVYQLTGSPPNYTYSALPNPVIFGANGVPENNSNAQVHIYYYPYDEDGNLELYFIRIFDSLGAPQYTLQAWPNLTEQDSPENFNNNVDNQIANGQFSQVLFLPGQGTTLSFTGAVTNQSFPIAPGWEIILSSTATGSIIIQQVSLEGSLNVPTNPPDYISFQPSGNVITSLKLRQTLYNNPDIWSTTTESPGYIAGAMLITSLDGQPHTLEMQYEQSGGPAAPQTIVSGSTGVSGYVFLTDTVLLSAGTNTDNSIIGAIYIDIILPNIGYYGITSIQVAGVDDNVSTIPYQQETVNRQISHLFYYYQSGLKFKPIKSYLCGWDFPLNPAQALGSTVSVGAVTSAYVWDQTIIYQSMASSISVTRSTVTNLKGSLDIEVANTCQFAVIQYLTVPQIIDLLSNDLSSNIVLSSNQSALSGMITLWYTNDATAPNINSENKSLVVTLTSAGKPTTFNGTWYEIPRSNYGDAIFTTESNTDINNLESFGFNGWNFDQNTAGTTISSATYVAIVIGFSSVTAANNVVIQSCSLVPGSVPTIPSPQTYNEVLEDCEYYYEKSYESSTVPATATQVGAIAASMHSWYDAGSMRVYSSPFSIIYKESKVSIPVVNIYSYTTGTIDTVIFYLEGAISQQTFSTYFGVFSTSLKCISYYQGNSGGLNAIGGTTFSAAGGIYYQYTADSRIGVYTP